MVWRGRFSIRDGRSAASSIQGYEPAGPILDYALKPQIMAPGYLPEAFAINDSCKADGRKRRGPEQLSFIHQGEIARALSYLLVALTAFLGGNWFAYEGHDMVAIAFVGRTLGTVVYAINRQTK